MKQAIAALGIFCLAVTGHNQDDSISSSSVPPPTTAPAIAQPYGMQTQAQALSHALLGEIAVANADFQNAYQQFDVTVALSHNEQIAERQTQAALALRDIPKIIAAAKKWVAIAPNNPKPYDVLLQALLHQEATDNSDEMIQVMAAAIAHIPDRDDQFLHNMLILTGNRSDHKEQLLKKLAAFAEHTNNKYAWFYLILSAYDAQNMPLSQSAMAHFRNAHPSSEDVVMLNAQLQLRDTKRLRGLLLAECTLKKYVAQHLAAYRARSALISLYIRNNQLKDAKDQLLLLVDPHVTTPQICANCLGRSNALALLGSIHYDLGRYRTAIFYLQKAKESLASRHETSFDPDQLTVTMADAYYELAEYEEAFKLYIQLSPQNPNYGEIVKRIIACALFLNKLNAVTQTLQYAKDRHAIDEVHIGVIEALVLQKQDHLPQALALLEHLNKTHPHVAAVLSCLGMVSTSLGHIHDAERYFKEVIQLMPKQPDAYNSLAFIYAEYRFHLDEAQRLLHTALRLAPHNPYILDSLGWLYYRQGRLQKAMDVLLSTYRMLPDSEIGLHLAEVMYKRGYVKEAQILFKTINRQIKRNEKTDQLRTLLFSK